MTTKQKIIEEFEEKLNTKLNPEPKVLSYDDGSNAIEWENKNKRISKELSKALDTIRDKTIEEVKGNVGALRQWLNEDRITDKKMVTNEEIEHWLGLKTNK